MWLVLTIVNVLACGVRAGNRSRQQSGLWLQGGEVVTCEVGPSTLPVPTSPSLLQGEPSFTKHALPEVSHISCLKKKSYCAVKLKRV